MFLTYRPDGQDEQRWEVKLGKFRSMEIEAIEKVTGLDYGTAFKDKLIKGNGLARRALLWTLQRREHPTIRFADIDFADDELQLELDRDELLQSREAIADADGIGPDEKAMALSLIDAQLADFDERREAAGDDPGKAPTPSDASSTGSPSAS
jgi:hypothetical protein